MKLQQRRAISLIKKFVAMVGIASATALIAAVPASAQYQTEYVGPTAFPTPFDGVEFRDRTCTQPQDALWSTDPINNIQGEMELLGITPPDADGYCHYLWHIQYAPATSILVAMHIGGGGASKIVSVTGNPGPLSEFTGDAIRIHKGSSGSCVAEMTIRFFAAEDVVFTANRIARIGGRRTKIKDPETQSIHADGTPASVAKPQWLQITRKLVVSKSDVHALERAKVSFAWSVRVSSVTERVSRKSTLTRRKCRQPA